MLASIFVDDAHSGRARAWLPNVLGRLRLSDWTVTEFTSAMGIVARTGRLTQIERMAAERALDDWIAQGWEVQPVASEDVRAARALMQATPLPLRAPDALHLAIVRRNGDALASFDAGLLRAAAALGLGVEPP